MTNTGIMQTNRRRRRKLSTATSFITITFLTFAIYIFDQLDANQHIELCLLHYASAAPTENADESSLPRPINYYELLDLESPNMHRKPKTQTLHNRKKRSAYRARISNDQIKKAYRKQAQLYHPDKLAARRLKQEKRNVTNSNATGVDIGNDPLANMTVEEATSLFAKIAEAYQVLSDPAQRYEYDWELLEMEDEHEEERLLLLHRQQEKERESGGQAFSEYDSFPLYETIRNGASSFNAWKDNLNLDPWAVFEDFFFQESTMVDEPDGSGMGPDNNKFYSSDKSYGYHGYYQAQSRQSPPRLSEKTVYRGFDQFGSKVYTVLRREDYIHEKREDGKYFYQILGQDFISGTQIDPYTGFTLREYYSAVTEPYLVEEGYSNKDDDVYYDTKADHSERSSVKHRLSIHKLEQGESITPNRSHTANQWISPNGRYEAVLSPTCELQILHNDKSNDDVTYNVVWSSETYIPNIRADGCHLTLNAAGRLVLSVDYGSGLGSADKDVYNTVLWSSPMPPVVPHLFEGESINGAEPVSFRYYASLDNDGVIAVYRVKRNARSPNRENPATYNTATESIRHGQSAEGNMNAGKEVRSGQPQQKLHLPQMVEKISLIYNRLSKASIQQKKTKAALAWDHVRYNVGKLFTSRPRIASEHTDNRLPPQANIFDQYSDDAKSDKESRSECVYSTSPVGCLAPGRNAIHLTKTFAKYVKNSVKSMDSKFDQFLSHLTEPVTEYDSGFIDEEEDDDILDTLIRVTGAAGVQLGNKGLKLGKAGVQAAKVGMRRGRLVAGKVVGKMREKVGNQSVKWGERMSEKEDVDSFF